LTATAAVVLLLLWGHHKAQPQSGQRHDQLIEELA
jgi:hypothetical protein